MGWVWRRTEELEADELPHCRGWCWARSFWRSVGWASSRWTGVWCLPLSRSGIGGEHGIARSKTINRVSRSHGLGNACRIQRNGGLGSSSSEHCCLWNRARSRLAVASGYRARLSRIYGRDNAWWGRVACTGHSSSSCLQAWLAWVTQG